MKGAGRLARLLWLWHFSASYSVLPHNKRWWRDAILTERLWTVWHRLKRSQMGENLQGPICGSCWAQMKWGNGSSFKGMLLAVKDHKWLQLGTILRWRLGQPEHSAVKTYSWCLDLKTWLVVAGFVLKTWVKGSPYKKHSFSTSTTSKRISSCAKTYFIVKVWLSWHFNVI